MLHRRIASSCVLIGIITATIFVDWVFGLLATMFIVVGLYEFFTILENKGIGMFKYFGIGMGIVIPLSITFHFEPTRGWELLFTILALLVLIVMQFTRRQNSGAIVDISTTIFAILYISWSISFLIKIRFLDNGFGLLSSVLLITKLGDIGAYIVGTGFGKTPLLPRISPKKSVEGAIGGLVFSVLGAFVSMPLVHFNYAHLLFLGVFLGILGQLGDLSESLLKRDCQVKDSSSVVPRMGGVLDLVDSLIFTGPVFYFYISTVIK